MSFRTFRLRLIADDHSRSLCERYTLNNSLSVPTIIAPMPKARVIFVSADSDTSETLSLSDKIGGGVAEGSINILSELNIAYGSALHVLLDFQLVFLLIFEMSTTAHLLYIVSTFDPSGSEITLYRSANCSIMRQKQLHLTKWFSKQHESRSIVSATSHTTTSCFCNVGLNDSGIHVVMPE